MKKKMTIYQAAVIALMAALLCVLSPMTIPIGPIPISLCTFVIYLSVYLLGTWGSSLSVLIYLLIGLCGVPVFSGYSGGAAKLLGPTGGYLIGYVFISLVGGFIVERFRSKIWACVLGLIAGTAVLYAFGTAWFVISMKVTLAYALSVCVVPFLAIDFGKIVLATIIGKPVRSALKKAGLLRDGFGGK